VTEAALRAVGVVRSRLAALDMAPLRGDEGAPEAWLEIDEPLAQALADIRAGDQLVVLTWRSGAWTRGRRSTPFLPPGW
jgi:tRNA (Thr-GGU) A37 N-methylase